MSNAKGSNGDKNDKASTKEVQIPSDYFDRDTNVLRAELDILSTPHNADYREAAYLTVKNAQAQCSIDFAKTCKSENMMLSLDDFLSQILMKRRALTELTPAGTTSGPRAHPHPLTKLLGPVSDVYRMYMNKGSNPVRFEHQKPLSKDSAESSQPGKMSMRPMPFMKPVVQDKASNFAGGPRSTVVSLGPLAGGLRGSVDKVKTANVKPLRRSLWRSHSQGGHGSDSNSDSGSDTDSDDEKEDGHHGHRHHRDEPAEDTTFMGSLGFGPSGDMCLYQNYAKLSLPCQEAVQTVHLLRQQYWQEEQEIASPEGHCHLQGVIVALLGFFIVSGIVRRCVHHKRHKQVIFFKIVHCINFPIEN